MWKCGSKLAFDLLDWTIKACQHWTKPLVSLDFQLLLEALDLTTQSLHLSTHFTNVHVHHHRSAPLTTHPDEKWWINTYCYIYMIAAPHIPGSYSPALPSKLHVILDGGKVLWTQRWACMHACMHTAVAASQQLHSQFKIASSTPRCQTFPS
jgi:hypothetical protein